MLVSVFGTSTPYGFWGFSAVRHVVQALYGDHHHIHCLTIDELREQFPARDGKPVVFTSDCPDAEVSDLILGFDAPIFAFLDEMEDAVRFAMASRQMNVPDAIRFAARNLCLLHDVACSPRTRCYGPEHYREEVRDFVSGLARHIGGTPSSDQIEEAARSIVPEYEPRFFTTVEDRINRLLREAEQSGVHFNEPSDFERQLIGDVSGAYRPISDGKPLSSVKWPRDLFFCATENYAVPDIIGFIGPARILTWGPYLSLPRGFWIVQIRFEISQCYSGIRLGADVLINVAEVATSVEIDLPAVGKYSLSMTFLHRNPSWPIEVRIFLMRGAIEGCFSLGSVTLHQKNAAVISRSFDQSALA